jgi:ActR/RegA family two-component response regulator
VRAPAGAARGANSSGHGYTAGTADVVSVRRDSYRPTAACVARAAATGTTAIATPARAADAKLRVLVVENNADLRHLLALTIDAEPDLRCIGVTDRAAGALELAREQQPDVVVMDLLLDEGPSLPTARVLRESSPGTSVLVYSGHASPALAEEAQRWGVREYVTKGGDVEELLAAIRRCDRSPAPPN